VKGERVIPRLRFNRPLLATGAVTLAIFALAACGDDDTSTETAASSDETEQAFLEAMVPHHQSALAMAEVADRRAQAPEIKQLSTDIAKAQTSEIAQMRQIHERLFGSKLVADETAHDALGLTAEEAGMEHAESAAALEDAQPFDRAFVDEMVPHHQGAIAMAEAVLPSTDDPELTRLAEDIIAAQQREIEQMNAFRTEHYGGPVPSAPPSEAPAEEHEEH
jgi:uncharacterized protein (DUF305 family)